MTALSIKDLNLDLDSNSNVNTDLAKCIIMASIGGFIICKVDRAMFRKGSVGKIRKGEPILKIQVNQQRVSSCYSTWIEKKKNKDSYSKRVRGEGEEC